MFEWDLNTPLELAAEYFTHTLLIQYYFRNKDIIFIAANKNETANETCITNPMVSLDMVWLFYNTLG